MHVVRIDAPAAEVIPIRNHNVFLMEYLCWRSLEQMLVRANWSSLRIPNRTLWLIFEQRGWPCSGNVNQS